MKFTFENVYLKINFIKFLKNKSNIFNIIFFDFIINENIIQICLIKVIKIFKENVVYILLINNRIVC